jgi:hypothetical protein
MANKIVGLTSVLALTTLISSALIVSSPVSAKTNFAAKCEAYFNGNVRGLSVGNRNACLCLAAKYRKELYKRLEGSGSEQCYGQKITNFNLASTPRSNGSSVVITTREKGNNGWGNGGEDPPPGNSDNQGPGISQGGPGANQSQGATKHADTNR